MFNFYRIWGGIGVGLASAVSPTYIGEIAPAEIRGRLVSFNQFAIIFGMLVVYFVNYTIANQGDDAWQEGASVTQKLISRDGVVAIGNALDLGATPSVTEGIVSALNRSIEAPGETLTGLIQTGERVVFEDGWPRPCQEA